MTISSKFILALITACILSGCAGTDFKRPDPPLMLGKATAADITRVMGVARQFHEEMVNDQKVKTSHYAGYAKGAPAGAAPGRYPGVVPVRSMTFWTYNDLLVAQEFISSFPQDATEFDETKVASIIKGKTTRADILALLGKPNGDAIYPVTKGKGETAMVYSYSHVGNASNMKFYSKRLMVSLTADDIVSNVEFVSHGVL